VHVPLDLRVRIEDGLRRRIRDLVGIARRSGQAVSGWDSVREWLRAGRAGLLVEASDGSPAERSRRVGSRPLPVVMPLPAEVLGGIFGRERAVHVAVATGRLAERIAAEAARLDGLAAVPAAPPRGDRKAGQAAGD
jgi:ribosomal protein L7Ae-like RNA K-turn-binding protein